MRRGAAILILVGLAVCSPASVAAHVNRTVGPYTILVVLVEEPFYADNHAGFVEFWVRRGDVPVTGLDRTITAAAAGHGVDVVLPLSPLGADGFYVLDRTADGSAFDPQGGGAWTLTLVGSIEGTSLAATFPVMFPSYPRVGSPAAEDAPSAIVADGHGTGELLIASAAALLTLVAGSLLIRRRRILRA